MNKFCTSCGVENPYEAKFCKKCGNNLDMINTTTNNNEEKQAIRKTSKKAIASLIFSLLVLYGIGSILAIFFGHSARTDIKNSNNKLSGYGIATAGMIIGYITFALVILGILSAVLLPKLIGMP